MKIRNKLLLLSCAVCAVCATVAIAAPSYGTTASATEYGFYMDEGAAVRVNMGDSVAVADQCIGISFTTNVTEDYYTNTLKTTYATATSFVLTTEVAPAEGTHTPKLYTWELTDNMTYVDGVRTFRAALDYSDLTEVQRTQALALDLKATSYITVTKADSTTERVDTQTNVDTVRSMRAVAVSALGTEDKATLEQYLGNDETSENEATVYIETSEEKVLEGYDTAYMNAAKLAESTLGGKEIAGLEFGAKGELVLFDDENNFKKVPFQYVTKAIEQAEDLKAFTITADVVATTTKTIEGYYVLTGNLDATSQTAEHHAGLDSGTYAYNKSTEAGFAGTFDGNGYTLSANVDMYGLFGALADNAVIKNIVLNLYATTNTTYDRCSTLLAARSNASEDAPATIENVYVKMNDNRTKTTFNVSLFRYGQHSTAGRGFKAVKMINLVVENVNCAYDKADDGLKYAKAAGMIFLEDAISYASAFATNTSNVYILASKDTPLSITAAPTGNQSVYTAQYYRTSTSICFKNFSYISALSDATNLAWTYDATSGRLTVK